MKKLPDKSPGVLIRRIFEEMILPKSQLLLFLGSLISCDYLVCEVAWQLCIS